MLYMTYVHSLREGLMYLSIEESTDRLVVWNTEKEILHDVNIHTDPKTLESEFLIEFLTMLQRVVNKDIGVLPMPETFTWVDTEEAYGSTYRKINLGYGWLYPNNNTYVFISNEFSRGFLNKQLPIKLEGASITRYKSSSATYKIEDNDGYSYVVPYYIIEIDSYTQNPLTHFFPFKLDINVDDSSFEWEDVEDCNIKIYTKTKSIGNTVYLYIKDSYGVVYSSIVNYAVLRRMSPRIRDYRLGKSLIKLSAPGPYLSYIQKILNHIGVN